MQALSTDHVVDALRERDFDVQLLHAESPTPTSEDAAAEIGCTVGQIAKSICFMVDGDTPLLVVASGDQQVDDRKIAGLFNVGRKKVKMAKPDQCVEIFGYPPGGVPPVGHRSDGIKILLDETLRRFDKVYAAAGSAQINFGITPDELERVTGGQYIDVAK